MICPAKALREYVWLDPPGIFPMTICEVAFGANTIGTTADKFEGPAMIGGTGERVTVGEGGGVTVEVGVITDSVEVEMPTGEGCRTVSTDCGCRTFTWNEQALVNTRTSRTQFFFMFRLLNLYIPYLATVGCLV
jgi:hypothetical protein